MIRGLSAFFVVADARNSDEERRCSLGEIPSSRRSALAISFSSWSACTYQSWAPWKPLRRHSAGICRLTVLSLLAHYVRRIGDIYGAKPRETRQRRARSNTAYGLVRRFVVRDRQRVDCADHGLRHIVYVSPLVVGGCHGAASASAIRVQCYCTCYAVATIQSLRQCRTAPETSADSARHYLMSHVTDENFLSNRKRAWLHLLAIVHYCNLRQFVHKQMCSIIHRPAAHPAYIRDDFCAGVTIIQLQ